MTKKKPERKPPSRRSQQQGAVTAERRARVSNLYRRGYAFVEIAKLVDVHPNTITDDLKALKAEWRETRLMNMDEAIAEQLAKIDLTEREAWDAWEKSKQDAKLFSKTDDSGTDEGGPRTITRRERRGQYGDPRFHDVVLKCIAQRCKLLGLEPPEKSEVSLEYKPPPTRAEVWAMFQQIREQKRRGSNVSTQ